LILKINLGIAQNILRLGATYQQNMADGIDLGDNMFGVVAIGRQ
jgi:hypothetical protein